MEVEPGLFSQQQDEREKRKRQKVETDAWDNNMRTRSVRMKSRGEGEGNERGSHAASENEGRLELGSDEQDEVSKANKPRHHEIHTLTS